MAQSLGASDYGWFSPADLFKVIEALQDSSEQRGIVLVGGQALTAWVQYYRIALPPIEEPYLTQDADFLGSKEHAMRVAIRLDGKAQFPSIDDHTPNTAVVVFDGEDGAPIQLDFLGAVLGIRTEEVRRLVVPLSINGSKAFPTLHPLLVLESRFHNLLHLPGKRAGNGITQAKVACEVVGRYMKECLARIETKRHALKAARRLSALAQSLAGLYVWRKWGIDPMDIVDPNSMPGRFRLSWKYEIRKVERKRSIASGVKPASP